MKRLQLLASFLLTGLAVSPAPAQETPKTELEFFQKLRERGYFDLAQEQLDKLRAVKDAEVQAILPLESARLQLAIAKTKPLEDRAAFFLQARKDLEAYVKANAGKPEGVEARLELARLLSYQGEATLSRALREPSQRTAHELARPAEKQFIDAGVELEAAAKALAELADSYKNPNPKEEKRLKQQLESSHWSARVDRGVNHLNQARTFIDLAVEKVNQERTKRVVLAREAFKDIVTRASDPSVQYVALAWLGKAYIESDDPDTAGKYLKRVIDEKDKSALAGKRWALYFIIPWAPTKDIKSKEYKLTKAKPDDVKANAIEWIKSFPAHLKTPEGQAVQFELGEAYLREAYAKWIVDKETASKKEKDKKKAREIFDKTPPSKVVGDLLDKAQKLFDAVAVGESDYAEKAGQQSIGISFERMGEATPTERLKDFSECFLKAQFELMKMRQAMEGAAKDPGGAERERQKRLKQGILALRRGLALADARTPPSKVDEARLLLATAYLHIGDLERAAVLGQFLAEQKPATRNSPAGAGYALEAYAGLLARDASEDNRRRLRQLAEFVLSPESQKLWAADPVTPVARYQLAMAFYSDEDAEGRKPYRQVVEELLKLPVEFRGYIVAQAQLVAIALEARDQKDISPENRVFYDKTAREAVARLKELPASPDSSTATMFFAAKLEHAKFLLADAGALLVKKDLPQAAKLYGEMGSYVDNLKTQFDKQPEGLIPAERRESIEYYLGVLKKYSAYGQAEVEFRSGRYDKVLALTAATLNEVRKQKPDAEGKIRRKDFQVAQEVLGLVLRAQVQKGSIKEARETLSFLEALAGEDGDVQAGMTNVLRELGADLENQVRELKAAGDVKALELTKKNFSAFLDDLAARVDKKADINDLTFLAGCFASLEHYDRAATLFQKVPPPAFLSKPAKHKFSDVEERELYNYWRIQLEYAKTLRLWAKATPPGKKELEKANDVVEALLAHDHGRYHLMAKKERLHIYEESALFGQALKGWNEFMNERFIKDRLPEDSKLAILFGKKPKEVYFESYYHYGYCAYKLAQSDVGKKAGLTKKYTDFAAGHLLRLKTAGNPEGWLIIEPLFNEFRAAETVFREVFDALEEKEKKEKKEKKK